MIPRCSRIPAAFHRVLRRVGLSLVFALTVTGATAATLPAAARAAREDAAPDVHLLAVGVSKYANYRVNILFAEKDAQAIADALTAALREAPDTGPPVGQVHSHVLTGRQATLKNIKREMKVIAEEARPEDLFVFFFSGFAEVLGEDEAHCLLMVDTPKGEAALEASLSTWQLTTMVNRLPTSRMLLLLDTCDSAEALKEFTRQVSGAGGGGLHLGVISPLGEAFENHDVGHGVFTSFLLQGIRGEARSDQNADGMLSFLELSGDLGSRTTDLDPDFRVGSESVGADFLICPSQHREVQEPAEVTPTAPTRLGLLWPDSVVAEGETILRVQATGAQQGRTVRVSGVSSKAEGIRSYLDAELVPGASASAPPVAEVVTVFEIPVQLTAGPNQVQVEVLEVDQSVAATRQFVVEAEAATRGGYNVKPKGKLASEADAGAPGKTYALIIATNEYDPNSGWNKLKYPRQDATRLQEVLKDTYGIDATVLFDATQKQFDDTVDGFLHERGANHKNGKRREFGPNDQLLIFLAGHGHREVDEETNTVSGYLVCSDSQRIVDSHSTRSYVDFNNLLKRINSILCPHILLLVDICHGGGIIDESGARTEDSDGRTRGFTRACIASGGPQDTVPDKSLFFQRIYQKLKDADEDWVSKTILYQQVEFEVVPRPWEGSFGNSQGRSDFRIFPLSKKESGQ